MKHGEMDENRWEQNHITKDTVIRHIFFHQKEFKMKKIILLFLLLDSYYLFLNCKLQKKNKKLIKEKNNKFAILFWNGDNSCV